MRRASARTRPAGRRGTGSGRPRARPGRRARRAALRGPIREHEAAQLLDREQRVEGQVPPALEPPDPASRDRRRVTRPSARGRRAGRRAGLRPGPTPAPSPRRTAGSGSNPRSGGRSHARPAAYPRHWRRSSPQRRSVAVLDARLRPQLEPPARLLQPPAEVGVLGRAHALVEAADLLERGPAHHQVRGHRARPVGVGEMGLLAEEAARGAVARRERRRRRAPAATSPASAPTRRRPARRSTRRAGPAGPGSRRRGTGSSRCSRARRRRCGRAPASARALARTILSAAVRPATTPELSARISSSPGLVVELEQRRHRASRAATTSPANGITTLTAGRVMPRPPRARARSAPRRRSSARSLSRAPADGRSRSGSSTSGIAANAAARRQQSDRAVGRQQQIPGRPPRRPSPRPAGPAGATRTATSNARRVSRCITASITT